MEAENAPDQSQRGQERTDQGQRPFFHQRFMIVPGNQNDAQCGGQENRHGNPRHRMLNSFQPHKAEQGLDLRQEEICFLCFIYQW